MVSRVCGGLCDVGEGVRTKPPLEVLFGGVSMDDGVDLKELHDVDDKCGCEGVLGKA